MTGGWNPRNGRDPMGSRPPFAPYAAPISGPAQPYPFHSTGPGYSYGAASPPASWANTTYGAYSAAGQAPPPPAMYPPQGPVGGFHAMHTFSQQPNGNGSIFPRHPQVWPCIDPSMPAAQLSNSTGGVGCEPGYNYFFAPEHTKAHVFRSETPPWQLPAATQIPFTASHIPCNTTLAELLKGYGCTNPSPKKNRVYEITSGGGGKWYRGLEVNGGDKESMKKTIGEIGWDATRTGNAGQKPVVCLWFCKD